jgi:hypothetical protein
MRGMKSHRVKETGTGRRAQRHAYETPKDETSFLYYVPSSSQLDTPTGEQPGGSTPSLPIEQSRSERAHPLTAVTEEHVPQLAPRLLQRSMLERKSLFHSLNNLLLGWHHV